MAEHDVRPTQVDKEGDKSDTRRDVLLALYMPTGEILYRVGVLILPPNYNPNGICANRGRKWEDCTVYPACMAKGNVRLVGTGCGECPMAVPVDTPPNALDT